MDIKLAPHSTRSLKYLKTTKLTCTIKYITIFHQYKQSEQKKFVFKKRAG